MKKVSIVCDGCGKEISQTDKRIKFRYVPTHPLVNFTGSIWGTQLHRPQQEKLVMVYSGNGLEIVVEFTSNLHFCSEECMMNWIKLQIKNAVPQIDDSEK